MAKAFSANDARRVIENHNRIISRLEEGAKYTRQYRTAVLAAADELVARQVLDVLDDIPVEELNRGKRGFRTKLLREHGYNTVADISAATVSNLEAINGIGEDSARMMKIVTRELVDEARKAVKVRLSEDDKNPSSTALVYAISRYRLATAPVEVCKSLLLKREYIEHAQEMLAPALNGFRWFFAAPSAKQEAEKAYDYLRSMLDGEYAEDADKALVILDTVQNSTEDDAWQDFSINSIQFFNILENLAPGTLGESDAVYGLPEELAKEIQDECFFPNGLRCELRNYQEWGVKYILHQERVLLGDEMGLGKTIQAIAAMVSLKNTGATHFVVVCPASVIANWCREIRKHSALSVIKVHGASRYTALRDWLRTGGVAVTTYETTGYFVLPEEFRYAMLVVDEAHYIKNPSAQRSISVKRLSESADRLLFMTGTALENRVDEMVELIRILQPEIAKKIKGKESFSSAPQFRELVAPVYYRRRREEVLTELPELIESKEWCDMNLDELVVYEAAVLDKRFADARRVSWNVKDINKSSKAQRLLEIVEEARSEGRKIIVFSFFLDTIRRVSELLGDSCMGPINGSVPPQRRQSIIDEFEKAPAGTVLAAQIQSGGTGLNIQTASVVILCEPQFKPSIENQAISRAYRMGQTRNVLVYRLLCENSVDERITEILEEKQSVFDAFADTSVAASESFELDDSSFGSIINEEIARIQQRDREK